MKRFFLLVISLIAVAALSASAAANPSTEKVPPFPGTLGNAHYVYVASYDGDEYDPNLLNDDRNAIGVVQTAIQNWGKLMLVFRPSDADIVVLVTSRPSEDLLAVYDARQWPRGTFLWRISARGGLQSGDAPLVTQFEKGFDSVSQRSAR